MEAGQGHPPAHGHQRAGEAKPVQPWEGAGHWEEVRGEGGGGRGDGEGGEWGGGGWLKNYHRSIIIIHNWHNLKHLW